MITAKKPLPSRLFTPQRRSKLLRTFRRLVIAYAILAVVITILDTKYPRVTDEQFLAASLPMLQNQADPSFVGVDPEPKVSAIPDLAPFVEFPEYRPWVGNPGWKEAQTQLPAYQAWVERQHPGYAVEVVEAVVTAYTPHASSCGDFADGRTATMADAWQRGIAVPKTLLWRWRAAGTLVHVPGYMWQSLPGQAWKPDDCGSALLRTWRAGMLHIDVRFQNESWAREWGVRRGWVLLLRPRRD